MNISDWITLAGVIASTILTGLTLLNLLELKKTRQEDNRAYIAVNFMRVQPNPIGWRVVVKNYGRSPGTLKQIIVDPPLSYEKFGNKVNVTDSIKPLTEAKDIYLSPGQSITDAFPFNRYPDKRFNISVCYESLGKMYRDDYTIDLTFRSDVAWPSISENANVETCIRETAQNLEWFFETHP